MRITKECVLNAIGVLLILLASLRIYSMLMHGTLVDFFWLCNHAPLLIGLAILFRSFFWLTAEISLLAVGSLNWSLDFLSKLFFDKYFLGSTDYIFTAISPESAISILLHLGVLPLAVLGFFLIQKPKEKKVNAWKGSLLHVLILVPFVLYFGEAHNLNCFLKPCISWMPDFSLYPVLFSVAYFVLFVIPVNWVLVKLGKN